MKKILILLLLYFINCEKSDIANVGLGGEFDVVLPGDPSTGFKWYLDNMSQLSKNKIIIPRDISSSGVGRYLPSKNPKKGSKGIFIFGFKAIKESENPVIVRFVYKNKANKIKDQKIMKYRVKK